MVDSAWGKIGKNLFTVASDVSVRAKYAADPADLESIAEQLSYMGYQRPLPDDRLTRAGAEMDSQLCRRVVAPGPP